jgi:hypothetical protein
MYSMWEVHQLVTDHHDGLVRDAGRASVRRQLRAARRVGGPPLSALAGRLRACLPVWRRARRAGPRVTPAGELPTAAPAQR